MESDGSWRLYPAYDLTFSYGLGGEHSTTYLGEGRAPDKETLLALAKKHSIDDGKKIIEEVEAVIRDFEGYARRVDLKESMVKNIKKALFL